MVIVLVITPSGCSEGFFLLKSVTFLIKIRIIDITKTTNIMDEFHVDRAQGTQIYIDVTKGIVQQCKNGNERMIAKMNELYAGKHISFLKSDFEAKMKDCYYNVRPTEICVYMQNLAVIQGTMNKLVRKKELILKSFPIDTEAVKAVEESMLCAMIEREEAEEKVEKIRAEILTEHNFPA